MKQYRSKGKAVRIASQGLLVCLLTLLLVFSTIGNIFAQETVSANIFTYTTFVGSWQRHSWYANGLLWVVYSRDTDPAYGNFYYRTSVPGSGTWSAKTLFYSDINSATVDSCSVWFDGTYVHYIAYKASTEARYRMGTPAANGVINWYAAEDVETVAAGFGTPNICVDSNGYPWFTYIDGNSDIKVYKSSTKNGTFTNDVAASSPWTTAGTWAGSIILPLTAGKMVRIADFTSTDTIYAYRYTGVGWGAGAPVTSLSQAGGSYRGTYSAVAENDNVHLVFLEKTTYDIIYTQYDYSTNAFGAETVLHAAATATSYPVIQRDEDTNNLTVYWENDDIDDHMYYASYDSGNTTWTTDVGWINEAVLDGLPAFGYFLNCDYTCNANTTGIYYSAGARILKYKLLSTPWAVDTLSATGVTKHEATIRGEITSIGSGTTAFRGWKFGTDPALGFYDFYGDSGAYGLGVYSQVITGLDKGITYYYSAYVEDSYGYIAEGNITSFTTASAITLDWLVAHPVSSTSIDLEWQWNPAEDSTSKIGIYYKEGSYPTSRADGTRCYYGLGTDFTHKGLLPGTSYYYRAWVYDLDDTTWSADYVESWATTFGGVAPTTPSEEPDTWFTEPSCLAYSKLPLLPDAIDAIYDGFGIPQTTSCVLFTLLWIGVLALVAYIFTRTAILVTMVLMVLIIMVSIAGLLPMWMIAISISIGGLGFYIWQRS